MTASPTGDTIGEILKRSREAKNLTIEAVNRETKISVAVIRALEQDDMDSFASETYLKGFLKNYAIFLNLDPNQLWNMLSRQRGAAPEGKGTFWDIEEAVREEKLKSPRIVQRFIVPLLIIVIALLVFLYVKERGNKQSEPSRDIGVARAVSCAVESGKV
jgi:cytoskeletal protein RodZ